MFLHHHDLCRCGLQQQRLICKGQPLEDGTLSLHGCGVEAEGDVQLVVQSAEEAQERLREREAARKRAQVAEAVEDRAGFASASILLV